MVRGQMARHTSYNLRVLALLLPPTTIMASDWAAKALASCWRIWVAGQMVQRASKSLKRSFSRFRIFSHALREKVVWETASGPSISGSASTSASVRTIWHSPGHHAAVPCTSG